MPYFVNVLVGGRGMFWCSVHCVLAHHFPLLDFSLPHDSSDCMGQLNVTLALCFCDRLKKLFQYYDTTGYKNRKDL